MFRSQMYSINNRVAIKYSSSITSSGTELLNCYSTGSLICSVLHENHRSFFLLVYDKVFFRIILALSCFKNPTAVHFWEVSYKGNFVQCSH